MYLKLFTMWSSTITSWTKGCHWYMWNFILTRYSVGFSKFCFSCFLNGNLVNMLIKVDVWQIFRALSYIHRCIGVCHRDIKPQNLLVCSNICFYCDMVSPCWLIILVPLFLYLHNKWAFQVSLLCLIPANSVTYWGVFGFFFLPAGKSTYSSG